MKKKVRTVREYLRDWVERRDTEMTCGEKIEQLNDRIIAAEKLSDRLYAELRVEMEMQRDEKKDGAA